jgi:hypothetical protein
MNHDGLDGHYENIVEMKYHSTFRPTLSIMKDDYGSDNKEERAVS